MSNDILIRPLVTEKLTYQMAEGKYAFVVKYDANKGQIKRAIKARYPGVKVRKVNTMIQRGKRRSQQTRRGMVVGRTSAYKKAIVTIDPDGEQIDFFEQV